MTRPAFPAIMRVAAIAVLIALGILAGRHAWRCLRHPYPLEYGEGINLLWSQRVREGLPLYPAIPPETFPQLHNPYPPAGPLITAALARAGLDTHPFQAGRLLALTGLLLATAAIAGLVRRRASRTAAACAAGLFLLSPIVFRFGPMMRIDTFALGLSLQAVNLADRRPTPARLALAGALAMAALLSKVSYAAAAAALALTCLQQRRTAPIAAAIGGALVPAVIVAALLWSRESPHLYLHLAVLNALPPDPSGALDWMARVAGAHAFALAAAVSIAPRPPRAAAEPPPLLRTYAWLCLAAPLLGGFVTGAAEHYALELWAVTLIAAAVAWDRWRETRAGAAWGLLLMQALLFIPLPPAPVFTRTYGQEIPAGARAAWTPGTDDEEIGRLLRSELATSDAPILAGDVGFLLLAGHTPVYQPYQFEQLAAAGRRPRTNLTAAIEAGRFSVILLKGDAAAADDPYFGADVQARIDRHYGLHRVIGPWHLYRR